MQCPKCSIGRLRYDREGDLTCYACGYYLVESVPVMAGIVSIYRADRIQLPVYGMIRNQEGMRDVDGNL